MKMPNFLVIGAMKAGTSSVYHYLKEHPEIFMSPVKEPNFFAFEKKVSFSGLGDRELRRITDLEAYRDLFAGATDEKAVGEASTVYLYSPTAAGRIRHHLPHVRVVAILRDPVERAYSNYLHWVRLGFEPIVDFWEAVQAEEQRIRENWDPGWHYVGRGFYYGQLRRYFDAFPRSQIMVYLYDDLVANPLGLMRNIFRFLGVDETFVPDVSVRYNPGGLPRSKQLHWLLTKPPLPISVRRALVPERLRQRVTLALKSRNLYKPPLSEEVRTRLRCLYREDILRLQDLIERDLSHWLA